ncbi:MAG TPA: AAA family ATPase [Pseudolabrys sp.]|nr:AAA family ATPase [Pseudolabrys sp.]
MNTKIVSDTQDDIFDDGMSRPEREEKARRFVRDCPPDADPIDIAVKMIEHGLPPSKAELVLRQEWGNRQNPPTDPKLIARYVTISFDRLFKLSKVALAADQHLAGLEIDYDKLAQAVYRGGQLRRVFIEDEQFEAAERISPTPYQWRDPAEIPQRQWLYRSAYIAGYVALTTASGGGGKSSLVRAECAAIASGKPLLGTEPERARVWYWCGEDPADEIERAFAAIRLFYKLKPQDLVDWL